MSVIVKLWLNQLKVLCHFRDGYRFPGGGKEEGGGGGGRRGGGGGACYTLCKASNSKLNLCEGGSDSVIHSQSHSDKFSNVHCFQLQVIIIVCTIVTVALVEGNMCPKCARFVLSHEKAF